MSKFWRALGWCDECRTWSLSMFGELCFNCAGVKALRYRKRDELRAKGPVLKV
jgi:hypothetical protein